MKKRALGIILSVLCVLLLFSACGGKDKKEKKKSDEAKVKVEKEESEEKEDEEEEVKLSPEEGTPFTTEAVRDVTMGPVTVHCQWIPFESPYIVDDIFSGRVAAAGDRVWILADGKLKEYQYANDAVTFVKDISIGDGYSEITADETGNLYVSSKLSNNAFLRIKDGNIEELAKDIGPVKMQRSGNVGISALFDIKKIVVADGTATAQDWMPQEHDIISTALISENYAYIGGRSEELDAYILKAYDMEGNHLLTFGEKGKDGDDWLAYVSQIMEIPEGFFGIDANMRDLYIWGPDASVLGSVEAPDLFGARYAWIAGGGKDMSGSEYLGKWKATKAEYAGIEVGVDTVFDEFHFTLQDNGKVKLNVNGDETTGKWDETENGISIEDEMEFQKLDDNTLTYEVSGVTVHFARD